MSHRRWRKGTPAPRATGSRDAKRNPGNSFFRRGAWTGTHGNEGRGRSMIYRTKCDGYLTAKNGSGRQTRLPATLQGYLPWYSWRDFTPRGFFFRDWRALRVAWAAANVVITGTLW